MVLASWTLLQFHRLPSAMFRPKQISRIWSYLGFTNTSTESTRRLRPTVFHTYFQMCQRHWTTYWLFAQRRKQSGAASTKSETFGKRKPGCGREAGRSSEERWETAGEDTECSLRYRTSSARNFRREKHNTQHLKPKSIYCNVV